MSSFQRSKVTVLVAAGLAAVATMGAQRPSGDEAAIKDVIARAYVRGVFIDRNPVAVRSGFHPEFVLSVIADGKLRVVSLEAWLERLALDGRPTADPVDHVFRAVDITGDTATAKLDLYQGGRHRYTDYFGLYRFPEGWRIVNKIFQGH